MGQDMAENRRAIAQFSPRDAERYPQYEAMLGRNVSILNTLMDMRPPVKGSFPTPMELFQAGRDIGHLLQASPIPLREQVGELYELLMAPSTKILDQYFESDILKTTLATDAVIGAFASPSSLGTAYVLLHHVMGGGLAGLGLRAPPEQDLASIITGAHPVPGPTGAPFANMPADEGLGVGSWAYAVGGMGAVSAALARSALAHGAEICSDVTVERIVSERPDAPGSGAAAPAPVAKGVQLASGEVITSKVILSNATPRTTMEHLVDQAHLDPASIQGYRAIDYSSATMKINLALDRLPDFSCIDKADRAGPYNSLGVKYTDPKAQPYHQTTIHIGHQMADLESAFQDAVAGRMSQRPLIELTIPSVLDPTLAPPGKHVANLFVQYAPYSVLGPDGVRSPRHWSNADFKRAIAQDVYRLIEEYAPGFRSSVLFEDVLSPVDLEQQFGLTGGNIFHGSVTPDQLFLTRPTVKNPGHATPIERLFICGSGVHPGGGVMGAPGRNTAKLVLSNEKNFQ
ncbi:hypothetical protein, variant [Fonticula alba]|nr:hypothetical protein, variant [Fonticula alba]KCV72029.1 hypothetical protein, variant [Fonticula alba]|eukprot:XP_009493606.1 hypothetical protein, variant [Fonticula alba]